MSRSVLDMYERVNSIMSRNDYTAGIATLELASLLFTYIAGMGIAVYKLPLLGIPITIHIYAAAADVVLAIFLYGSSTRSGNNVLRIVSILDIVSVLGAAFSGLFYFGGFAVPIYALGMGTGFVLGIAFTSFLLFYSIRK
ncbi:hypothetical protein [Sulfuracidifex metallicus]|uniref:hypothetical protein n=1 Tax=Sulfuracidifex metallicus TaxID=47303 RepID=UPI0023F4B2F8|nr:hypothetical protein [Sulfuracidifex metallicus]